MANAGYSSDYKLCKAITRGVWKYKQYQPLLPIPKHKDEDDIHQTALKNMLIDYYNAFHNPDKIPWYVCDKTKRNRSTDKVIYQMNQYRQKHWYWKAII